MAEERLTLPHKLVLNERTQLTMTGVHEVLNFDENAVVVQTDLGRLLIQGQELKLKTLSPEGGQVRIEGNITAMQYEQSRDSRGGLRRLLR
jgi:sporulation protein YabP